MDQPTTNEVSHAQLHTSAGFRFEPMKLIRNSAGVAFSALEQARIRKNWEYDSHLHPTATSLLMRYQWSYKAVAEATPKNNLMPDQSRIARDDEYNKRTGLPEFPEIPEVRGNK